MTTTSGSSVMTSTALQSAKSVHSARPCRALRSRRQPALAIHGHDDRLDAAEEGRDLRQRPAADIERAERQRDEKGRPDEAGAAHQRAGNAAQTVADVNP